MIKYILISILTLVLTIDDCLFAQNRDFFGNTLPEHICSKFGYLSNKSADSILERICDVALIDKRNIVMIECSDRKNFEAAYYNNTRIIIYNSSMLDEIKSLGFIRGKIPSSSSNWDAVVLFAHEIGHHQLDHTINPEFKRKKYGLGNLELAADEFAGRVLFLLGASLDQAQNPYKSKLIPEQAESGFPEFGYPGRQDRLKSVANGYLYQKKKSQEKGGKIEDTRRDSDKDGVDDNSDNCPNEPGEIDNKGCPADLEKMIDDFVDGRNWPSDENKATGSSYMTKNGLYEFVNPDGMQRVVSSLKQFRTFDKKPYFKVSVMTFMKSCNYSSSYGLMFCGNKDLTDYYLFGIRFDEGDGGFCYVKRFVGSNEFVLAEKYVSDIDKNSGVNRLTIEALDLDHVYFYINDEIAGFDKKFHIEFNPKFGFYIRNKGNVLFDSFTFSSICPIFENR
jgi:hypothetical protein